MSIRSDKHKKPSKESIVIAQSNLLDVLDKAGKRPEDPLRECWGCLLETDLQRAHVIARSNGGSYDPSNFWLLCWICHENQPDSLSVEDQTYWLLKRPGFWERQIEGALSLFTQMKKMVEEAGIGIDGTNKVYEVMNNRLNTTPRGIFFSRGGAWHRSNALANLTVGILCELKRVITEVGTNQ